ncbi:MAG TPA: hypothetical protein VOA41_03140 [Candidatus Dormibacteraeota bacterium]|nr:hypothetical protein [Candidatus Dormibacteraeota bacterium]
MRVAPIHKRGGTWLVLLCVLGSCPHAVSGADRPALQNERYRIQVAPDGTLKIQSAGREEMFSPRFTVLYRANDPELNARVKAKEANFVVASWKPAGGDQRTADLFQAAETWVISGRSAQVKEGRIVWTFPSDPRFIIDAELTLPPGQADPQLLFHFTPGKDAWYSVGYTGAPAVASDMAEWIWQPLVWQERRFPEQSYLSMEFMAPLPVTLVSRDRVTIGVVADPAEMPYRIPTFANSRFGVLVRNEKGQAQPMLFAPVLGTTDSHMIAGTPYQFRARFVIQPGDWFEAFRHVARDIYSFHDYRENVGGSLNDTLNNMIALVMDDHYSEWSPEYKGFGYSDVEGTVKIVSSLHPFSIALLTDNQEMYVRRALPMIEYAMSREKFLFSLKADNKGQSASHRMRGPAVEVSELAALYSMSGGRSPVFRRYATEMNRIPRTLNLDMLSEAGSWQNNLALYRASSDSKYLDTARSGADRYVAERIDRMQTDFSDVHIERGGQFWTDFAPKWIDLLELYEETKEPRYLKAAYAGAKIYASYAWLSPVVPQGDIVIHQGGIYRGRRYEKQAPQQAVPAWRVAHVGLVSEASTTYRENYAVFLSHFAPYMLRLAYYTGDTFFRDIARAAVVGRYSTYAGYTIGVGDWTTLYNRPDFPLRTFRPFFPDDWSNATGGFGSYYSNHIFPNIALVADYLISDAFVRSAGHIHFPSEYAQGYAYLQSKVYGSKSGHFFGKDGVYLWMPPKLLHLDGIQANWVAGYGNGEFYLALLNQSNQPIRVKVTLNPDMIPIDAGRSYTVRTYEENALRPNSTLLNGEVTVPVAANGITALAVEGLVVMTRFQSKVFAKVAKPLSDSSYATVETPFGKVNSMLISVGDNVDSGYVWLEADDKDLKEARLHYKEDSAWKEVADKQYPFEFSLPISPKQLVFEYWVEGIRANAEHVRSSVVELRR